MLYNNDMPSLVKLNGIISLPADFTQTLELGKRYTIEKDGYRILPFNIPVEVADDNNHYLGKARVKEIKITESGTLLTFEMIKMFTPEEAKVFDQNHI